MKTDQKHSVVLRVLLAVLLAGSCIFGFTLFLQYHSNNALPVASALSSEMVPSSSSAPEASVSAESKPEPKTASITILSVGDDLIHDVIYLQAGSRAGGKGYNFHPVYEQIEKDIKDADISMINQETPIAGKVAPPSGYPRFNSPTQLGDELVNLGFDVINHANNHVLDMNEKGLAATLDYWATKPTVKVIGAYRDNEDLQNIRVIEAKGIKTAYIGITEMTNGLSLPKGSKYQLIYASNTQLIEQQIKKAKSIADVVVASVHWGNENTTTLTDKQTTLAQNLVDWGADIIFGSHPHVLQKLTVLNRKDGTKCPVIFSLGNFVSAQQDGPNMISGILKVTMTKNFDTNQTVFTDMKFKPTVTQYGKRCANITIYPLSKYSDTLAAAHGIRRFVPNFNVSYIHKIVDQSIPKEYQSN